MKIRAASLRRIATHVLFAAVACGVLVSADKAVAGAFNIGEDQGLVITGTTVSGGSRYFNGYGKLDTAPTFKRADLSAYVEYGVTDWLMAVIRPDLEAVSLDGSPKASYIGLGQSEAGAQIRLLSLGPAVFAAQGSFRLPGSTDSHNRALLGDTARSADARLLAGYAFTVGPFPGFVDAEVAYRFRDAGAPDEIHSDLTVGLRAQSDLLLMIQGFDTTDLGPGTPVFPHQRFTHIQAAAVYDLSTAWSTELAAYTTVFGRQSLRENGLTTAVWYRF